MRLIRNAGRVAGLWYLLLVFAGPLRLIYIPSKLFELDDPAATVRNIAAHQWLFRLGMVSDLAAALLLIFLTMAFYRLFKAVSEPLAVLVVIFGGVMPALIYFVNTATDGCALMIARGAGFLSAFSKPQQDALAVLLLKLHNHQNTAAETLWGVWLLPLAILVFRSGFLPRPLGVWLGINGVAYMLLSLTGILAPQLHGRLFLLAQPALFGELALMLWLVIKGSAQPPPSPSPATRSIG